MDRQTTLLLALGALALASAIVAFAGWNLFSRSKRKKG